MKKPDADLARAQYEAIQAKKRLASTAAALQYRLKPGTIVNNAWEGVRDKSSVIADDALQAVKDRPAAASGVVAAIAIFLVRHPLWRAATRLVSRRGEDEGIVKTNLDGYDKNYDLTAPTVERSAYEGVSA
ncbi:MAG TPA: hypothetical protein VF662_07505 [Allosphingosinicella sp.]|jgi:hypothetical protein